MGALFLSSKLEESPVRLRDLINVYDFLIQRGLHFSKHNPSPRTKQLPRQSSKTSSSSSSSNPAPPFHYEPQQYFSSSFYDYKDALVIAEMQILKRLGFQVQVNLPYATMVNYLQTLGLADAERHPGVAQRAWGILNDACVQAPGLAVFSQCAHTRSLLFVHSLQTPVYALFAPHVLAAASIYLVMHTMKPQPAVLPLEPKPWWELFDVTREELRIVCAHVLRLYDAHSGLAAAVRDEWGGLADFCERAAVREWIAAQSSSSQQQQQQQHTAK